MLELNEYDHNILFAHFDCIYNALPQLTPHESKRWALTLTKVWQRYYTFTEDVDFLNDFGVLAMQLNVWQVAKKIFILLTEHCPENAQYHFYLATVYLQTGQRTQARLAINMAVKLAPMNQQINDLSEQLHQWLEVCENDACYNLDLGIDSDISLHPLAAHYSNDFLQQYRDPTIAVMASLPNYETHNELLSWLDTQQNRAEKHTYAVVHREHGFVGIVSFSVDNEDAFFYFWIGVDYQGQGVGVTAANLGMQMLRQTQAIKRFHTCVFKDNSRSLFAMNSLGFRQHETRAKAPNNDYLFFINSEKTKNDNSNVFLRRLLLNIGSGIELDN